MDYRNWIAKTIAFIGLSGLLALMPVYGEDEEQTLELEEMTVTAEKREQKLQDVPMSISAFSETDLEDACVDEIRDLTIMVPNFVLNNHSGSGYQASVRGMNYSPFTNKLPMVMYVDNVPYDEGNVFVGDFNNIERIEVLRGAQGTLYGQNALAGIVNITTKTPGNESEGRVTAKAGEYGTYGINTYYNGPIIENKLFFGLSGSYNETAGFLKNDWEGEDTFGGGKTTRAKARVRWLATDKLTADMTLSLYQYRSEGGIGNVVGGTEYKDHESRNPDDVNNLDNNQLALELGYRANGFDFKSITTQRHSESEWVRYSEYYNDYLVRGSNSSKMDATTQEFRFQSPEDKAGLKWLLGLFFMNEKKDYDDYGMEYNYDMYSANATYNYFNYPGNLETNSQSVFGQVTLPVTEKLDLTAGLRVETIEKTMDYAYEVTDTYGSSGTSFTGTTVSPKSTYSITSDWSAVLPRAVLSYRITPEDMTYFSVSRGYLPGGFNMTASKNQAEFDAQYSDTYELGIKTSWLNNSLNFNATIFHIDITDMHVYDLSNLGVYVASNAGEARSQGFEFEIAALPVEGLNLAAAIGFVDTEFVDYEGYDGNKVSNTPEYTANFSAKYRHASGIYAGASIEGRGDAWANDSNTVELEEYWIAHTKIGYEKSDWDVYLQVENLTDVEYLDSIAISGSGIQSYIGKPRTASIIGSLRF